MQNTGISKTLDYDLEKIKVVWEVVITLRDEINWLQHQKMVFNLTCGIFKKKKKKPLIK